MLVMSYQVDEVGTVVPNRGKRRHADVVATCKRDLARNKNKKNIKYLLLLQSTTSSRLDIYHRLEPFGGAATAKSDWRK